MNNLYIVVGGSGIVGSQVVRRLNDLGKSVVTFPTREILLGETSQLRESMLGLIAGKSTDQSTTHIGLILAHRFRGENIQSVLMNELRVSRDFVWQLSELCASLRVIVFGSITGSLVDNKSTEAYHYSKDLQKSIVRQSIRLSNLHMNLLELNWFKKYPQARASTEYLQLIDRLRRIMGENNLPTVNSITDFSSALIETTNPPRGQTIVYDGGFSLFQIN